MSLPVNIDSIPEEMKALNNWVLWKYEDRKDSKGNVKKTKVPYQVNGRKAESTNPDTWGNIESIIKTLNRYPNRYDGIGFVFSQDSGIMGLDFDHVKDIENGEWDQEAQKEILSLNSYTEISPSGTGAHVIVKGTVPLTPDEIKAGKTGKKNQDTGREMYHSGRYFTVTGNCIEGTVQTVNDAQGAVNALYYKWFKNRDKNTTTKGKKQPEKKTFISFGLKLSDSEIIDIASRAKNSDKFKSLYNGCITGYPSQSEADQALCSLIAFYTQDSKQIDSIFRGSGLYRADKWEVANYRDRTINKALQGVNETYNPEKKASSIYPYVLTEKGVGKYQDIKDPEDPSKTKTILEYFLYTPAYISALSDDLDGEQILYKIGIEHPVNGHIDLWKDQGELLTRSGVNKLLSEGLIGTDSSYKNITTYFMKDILRAASEKSKKEFIAHKTGWKRDNTIFVAGNEAYTAEGLTLVNLTDKEAAKYFTKSGTLAGWVNGSRWILQYESTRINCYTVFASVIAGYLKQPSPILQNKGTTTTGKTLKSSVGISMIGNPAELVKSADTTRTAAERDSIATNGMCSILDEVGLLKNPDGLTYLLSNGKKKQRGTKEGREESEYWFKSFILNGEFEFLKESAAQGEIGRLIECSWTLPKDAINAKKTEVEIREHYGHITSLFLEKLFSKLDTIKDRYTTLCASLPSSDIDIGSRLKDSFALIIISGEILEDVFNDIGIEKKEPYSICEKLYIENITSERVKPYWIRGLSIIYDEVNVCKPEVDKDGFETGRFYYRGQIGGEDDGGLYIDILAASFKDMCEKHELKNKQLMVEFRDNGVTEVDNPGKNGTRKSQKTTKDKESRKTQKVIRLIKKKVYETLELDTEEVGKRKTSNENNTIDLALLKRDIRKHIHFYNMAHEERQESFISSFFREYPNLNKHYTTEDILDLLVEIQAEPIQN